MLEQSDKLDEVVNMRARTQESVGLRVLVRMKTLQ